MTQPPLRVAVIGARRVRQGTGEYVARELAALGHQVPAIVGTTAASVEEARAGLRARYGLDARGYTSLAALLERETVDAVAICSPHEAHEAQLALALEARLHVFAEKPLLWRRGLEAAPRREVEDLVGGLVDRCLDAGRYLHLNTQWPYTLPAFDALHPGARRAPLRALRMWLAPMTHGADAVVDAGSHLISMLQALLGPGDLADVTQEGGDELTLATRYVHAAGSTAVELELRRCETSPRPAGYRLNDHAVERKIELPSYRFTFEADGRAVPLGDPLGASVEDFVRSIATARRPDRASLVAGMTQLQALVGAVGQVSRSAT